MNPIKKRDLKMLFIVPGLSIHKALERMGRAGAKILFVVNDDQKLVGVVTDGDLRRWILKGKGLSDPISKAMNSNPLTLEEGFLFSEARNLLLHHQVECVPVLDGSKRVVSSVRWTDLFNQKRFSGNKSNIPVVIMAGGVGHRLAPLTKIIPKALVPIGEKPILELIMDRFRDQGSRQFILILGYKSQIIRAYLQEGFRRASHFIRYVDEKKPLGTAGGLNLIRPTMKETFWVSNCDILMDVNFSDVLRAHREGKNDLTLIGSIKRYNIPYGVCRVGASGELKSIDEKPGYDLLVNTGVYLMEPKILRHIRKDRFVHFTDVINAAIKKGDKVSVYPIHEDAWMDMGQIEELKAMSRRYGVDV
jgi:dTDP-glucose pyrophosphorylase